jgi:hypothetical protein
MKQSTIFVLTLISLSNITNAGVIRDDYQWGNFGKVSNKYNSNQNNWWNRNSWNALNIKNAVKESNTKQYNSNDWWNNWFTKSNNNNWWKFGNWWNQYSNTYPTFNNKNNSNNKKTKSATTKIISTTKALPSEVRTTTKSIPIEVHTTTKSIPIEVHTTTKSIPTEVHTTTKSIPTEVRTTTTKSIPTYVPTTTPAPIPTQTQAPVQSETPAVNQATSQAPVTLPIKEFTMNKFSKCSSEQTEILKNLIEDIKTYRSAAVYLLQNQNEDETFEKIFLKYYKDSNTFETVQKTFNNINEMTAADAYCETNEDEACADGAMAWTYLNSKEFHVCPSFFTDAMFGSISSRASEAASIVLHELTHCYGTEDFAYGERGSNSLNASLASNNADTFRLFAMSSIYYLNEKHSGLTKRDDDFLSESIDFHDVPFKDEVRVRPNPNLGKRGDDFLSESIDFHDIPFRDEVRVRPNPNQQ